ncbi:hypothetical protein BRADI_2g06373v3 [Brachypodium distachyon]|uniref:Uncharacterized protein n=1 Tax=Brachypodium distachyon TaxID=15368 RepID=A0A2K2D775_BRADI|nr:hypothetical protein BRADI_2g06373v3 [Brachypodium distachyon]
MDALLEEGELMVGIDGDDEGEAGKGHIKSENEVLPPVPRLKCSWNPHHKALPVGTISAVSLVFSFEFSSKLLSEFVLDNTIFKKKQFVGTSSFLLPPSRTEGIHSFQDLTFTNSNSNYMWII